MNWNPVSWPFTAKLAGAAAGALILAGGVTWAAIGYTSHIMGTPSAAAQAAPSSAPPALTTCTVYAQQHDARITVAGSDGNSECDKLITDLSSSGTFYSYQATVPSGDGWSQVCDVFSGSYEAVVYDDGGQYIGQGICAGFASSGWTQQQALGPLAQQIADQLHQQQQAQASASAAQQHDQQVSDAQSALAKDVPALVQDTSSLETDHSLADAIQSMKNDLGTEQTEWQTEQNASCSSYEIGTDAATVGTDAATVGTDLATLQTDVTGLQDNGISSVKTDLSSVQGDLSTLQGLGANPLTDSSKAVAAGNKALTDSANAISWANGQGDQINDQAQQLANTAQSYANAHPNC
jgi:hypothetical protein